MIYQIKTNFNRIGLHDSHLSDIKTENSNIIIKVDWGFLENFREESIFEMIVFDEANLVLCNVGTQTFKELIDKGSIPVTKPKGFETDIWLVMTNEYTFSNNYHLFKFTITNYKTYLEWTVSFENVLLEWNNFILHKNWLTGQETLD